MAIPNSCSLSMGSMLMGFTHALKRVLTCWTTVAQKQKKWLDRPLSTQKRCAPVLLDRRARCFSARYRELISLPFLTHFASVSFLQDLEGSRTRFITWPRFC